MRTDVCLSRFEGSWYPIFCLLHIIQDLLHKHLGCCRMQSHEKAALSLLTTAHARTTSFVSAAWWLLPRSQASAWLIFPEPNSDLWSQHRTSLILHIPDSSVIWHRVWARLQVIRLAQEMLHTSQTMLSQILQRIVAAEKHIKLQGCRSETRCRTLNHHAKSCSAVRQLARGLGIYWFLYKYDVVSFARLNWKGAFTWAKVFLLTRQENGPTLSSPIPITSIVLRCVQAQTIWFKDSSFTLSQRNLKASPNLGLDK